MTLRKGFTDILGNWSNIQDIEDIPRRIAKIQLWMEQNIIKDLEPLTDEEVKVLDFMKDVQATREHVRRRKNETA